MKPHHNKDGHLVVDRSVHRSGNSPVVAVSGIFPAHWRMVRIILVLDQPDRILLEVQPLWTPSEMAQATLSLE